MRPGAGGRLRATCCGWAIARANFDGAHVEYLRGIENVVGVKCGPTLTADELLRLIDRLDPRGRPGKLVLIGRFGAKRIGELLPPLMRATRGRPVDLDDRSDARQHDA